MYGQTFRNFEKSILNYHELIYVCACALPVGSIRSRKMRNWRQIQHQTTTDAAKLLSKISKSQLKLIAHPNTTMFHPWRCGWHGACSLLRSHRNN